MTETKFTPGPWKATDGEVHHAGYIVITAAGMRANTPLAKIGGKDWDDTARADAALIAAAPDLYAALEAELQRKKKTQDAIEMFHSGAMTLMNFEHIITGIFTGSDATDGSGEAALRKARGE